MNFVVYILHSLSVGQYYCGQTNDINDRIKRHNAGFSKSTKYGKPWQLVTFYELATRSEAMFLENKIKKRGIRRFLEDSNLI